MAEPNDEILARIDRLETALAGRLDSIDAKLSDVKGDIHLLCDKHLAPSEKKQVMSGSGPHWGVAEGIAAKNR